MSVLIVSPRTSTLDLFSMPESTVILNAQATQRALTRIAHEIAERNETSSEIVLVGIQRGGCRSRKN